jgi:DtxR family Mn-dependent transcriptional regulator
VDYQRSKGVRLSALGRKRTLEIIRHHRFVETFPFQMLDYPIAELHDEAERLEHFISEQFEAQIAKKLGDPESDPHGHCIPSLNGTMPRSHGISYRCGL